MTHTWTQDNTEGFTDDDLAALNAAQDQLEARFCNTGEDDLDWQNAKNIRDRLNNEWTDGATADYLVARVSESFA